LIPVMKHAGTGVFSDPPETPQGLEEAADDVDVAGDQRHQLEEEL
jgi:hypothetical protein